MNFQKDILEDFQEKQKLSNETQGTQGILYTAKKDGQTFAIKEISKEQNTFYDCEREVQFYKSFDHPNIIKFYDMRQNNASIYQIFEFMDNEDLKKFIQKNQKFQEKIACYIFLQILNGLDYLHNKTPAIIHRDLKPANIMLNKKFEFKLIDFGTANVDNTQRKTFTGTEFYMAPEIDKNSSNSYGKEVDIWSLGIILYELVAGIDLNQDSLMFRNKLTYPNHFSSLLKNLLNQMIKKDGERISTQNIYKHSWIQLNKIDYNPFYIQESISIPSIRSSLASIEQDQQILQSKIQIKSLKKTIENFRQFQNSQMFDQISNIKSLQLKLKQKRQNLNLKQAKIQQEKNQIIGKDIDLKQLNQDFYNDSEEYQIELQKLEEDQIILDDLKFKLNKKKQLKTMNDKKKSNQIEKIKKDFQNVMDEYYSFQNIIQQNQFNNFQINQIEIEKFDDLIQEFINEKVKIKPQNQSQKNKKINELQIDYYKKYTNLFQDKILKLNLILESIKIEQDLQNNRQDYNQNLLEKISNDLKNCQ